MSMSKGHFGSSIAAVDGVSQFCLIPGRRGEKHQVNARYSPASKLRFVAAPVLTAQDGGGQRPAAACHGTWLALWNPVRLQDEMEFGFLLLSLCEMKAKACSNMTNSESRLWLPLPSAGLEGTKPLSPASGGQGKTHSLANWRGNLVPALNWTLVDLSSVSKHSWSVSPVKS